MGKEDEQAGEIRCPIIKIFEDEVSGTPKYILIRRNFDSYGLAHRMVPILSIASLSTCLVCYSGGVMTAE